ncbi:MAG: hypothetical protein M1318_00890 [Firmicutes bacterium]|nr:hypothetical protein [Bacillota bacterium]
MKNQEPWCRARLNIWGATWVRTVGHFAHPQWIYASYRKLGFGVYTPKTVGRVPNMVVEGLVSRLRQKWRRYLFAEAVAGVVAGPAGILVNVTGLLQICLLWGLEMGWAYGLNMDDAAVQTQLRLMVIRGLAECLGVSDGWQGWRSLPRLAIQTALLGLGQDMAWADRIMARVRHYYRVQSQRLAVHPKIMSFHHNSITVHPVSMVIQGHVAHNMININGSPRRYAT